jgi:fatty acid desaturase
MALSKPSVRPTAVAVPARQAGEPLPIRRPVPISAAPAEPRPSYDASPEAYRRLRRSVIDAGVLERRYGYYLGRTLLSFAFVAVATALAFVVPSAWGWSVLVVAALGFAFAQVAMIGHDSGHHAVFKRAQPNWALGQLAFSLTLGLSFWYWRNRHNQHHVETNDEADDPDLAGGGLFTLSEREAASRTGWRRWVVRRQAYLFWPAVVLALSIFIRAEGWWFAFTRLRGQRRVVEVGLLVLHLALWTTPVLALGWGWLAIFLGGQIVAGAYLSMIIAPNHKGMPIWARGEKLTFLERQVISTRNITPGPIADFLFGGLNYQIEHHLFPTIPRASLGAARAIVRPFCEAQGLPYEEVGAWTSYKMMFEAFDECGRAAG